MSIQSVQLNLHTSDYNLITKVKNLYLSSGTVGQHCLQEVEHPLVAIHPRTFPISYHIHIILSKGYLGSQTLLRAIILSYCYLKGAQV